VTYWSEHDLKILLSYLLSLKSLFKADITKDKHIFGLVFLWMIQLLSLRTHHFASLLWISWFYDFLHCNLNQFCLITLCDFFSIYFELSLYTLLLPSHHFLTELFVSILARKFWNVSELRYLWLENIYYLVFDDSKSTRAIVIFLRPKIAFTILILQGLDEIFWFYSFFFKLHQLDSPFIQVHRAGMIHKHNAIGELF